MLIGIFEVSEPNHYSAVNGLIKTYASDPNNEIIVYTLPSIEKALNENGLPKNASLIVLEEGQSLKKLLNEAENVAFDRIHICTIFDNYLEFAQFKPQTKDVFFHVHQVEEWYNDDFKRAINTLIPSLKNKDQNRQYSRIIARAFVDYLIYRPMRKKMLAKFDQNYNLKLIVHSEGQKEALEEYSCKSPITVFPFAIYEGMEDTSQSNQVLRICIPGVITQAKRDYLGFFQALQQNSEVLRDRIDVYLLGYVTEREQKEMGAAISSLIDSGYQVIYHDSFVYGEEFDKAIANCDLLLNNQFISKNSTEVYGKTKESGMIFNMLRAAKPGLLPREYNVSSEFQECTLFFEDYPHLIKLIQQVLDEPQLLKQLKASAQELSLRYSPTSLYPRLV
ncbi:hypothetical protein [Pleurocapsa sp. PCC 7319]|uniref:hypothetical protein n=1 Tax=Pleurocapsa sp. PCC 7319 TaxID=118161 RepID=UPI000345D108|nr:hypothetical protein [Pleurocapsa sp. PCC 7319]